MSNVEEFPVVDRRLTEYEALVAAAPSALDAIPGAVYICDHDGWLVRFNAEAASLWGRSPDLSRERERYCGSHQLFLPNGVPLAHADCPMATAVTAGTVTRNTEVVIERPDGTRFTALVNIRPLKDHRGRIQGAINCFQDISAGNEMEDTLRRQSQDLEDFFENSAIGLHIVSNEGIILRANKAELNLLGYTAEEYFGRHIAEFHADAQVIGDILHRLSCGDELDRQPARLRAKDGSIRHVLITSNSRFENGKFVNTRCFTTDVTRLHDAEAARRESDERLAAAYEAASVGIAEVDDQGRLTRVNDAVCKMLGRPREQALGTRFFDHSDPETREHEKVQHRQQVRGEIDRYSIRKKVIRADGTTGFFDIFSSPVRDLEGKFRFGVRIIQDVTESKHMEDRIHESEKHMRDLLEALPAAVYTTDAAGRITFYNKAAVEMAGRTPDVGDEWCVTWRLYRTDGTPLPHDECPMAVALREKRLVRGEEAVAERPDGTRVPFIPYPTPLHDADGNLVGAINMLIDITERKQAESRQKTLIDELNHRVKNTLTTVQSLAGQTARGAENVQDFVRRFDIRILALARAHDLLTRRHWEKAPLTSLAREILQPVIDDAAGRVQIEGPAVEISPRFALNLTMALNELGTNAVKYGSLSSPDGTLSVIWRVSEEAGRKCLSIDWTERGGPTVVPPRRRGFGTRLMERCIERDLAGEFDLAFDSLGVSCRMTFPIEEPSGA